MVTLVRSARISPLRSARIEVLGLFGAGKTTLARKLARGRLVPLLEDHLKNPYWGEPRLTETIGHLGYDLEFLLQHIRQAADPDLLQSRSIGICDWSLVTDRLWASMRLGSEMRAYDAVHKSLSTRVGPPLGYLYLRRAPEVVLSNIRMRGRAQEKALETTLHEATQRLSEVVSALPAPSVLVIDPDFDIELVELKLEHWINMRHHA